MTPGKEGPAIEQIQDIADNCLGAPLESWHNKAVDLARYALSLRKALERDEKRTAALETDNERYVEALTLVRDEIGDCHHSLIAEDALAPAPKEEGKS